MIELRWREIFIPMGEGYERTDKVLQYRYQTKSPGLPFLGEGPAEWSEWQDVPTVRL